MRTNDKLINGFRVWPLTSLLVLLLQGCNDSQMISADTLKVDCQVLNESKLPTNVFNINANPVFRMSIKNEASEQLIIKKDFVINPALFKVYKYEDEPKQFVPIGSAVSNIALTQEIGLILQPNQQVVYEVPWARSSGNEYSTIFEISPTNKPLPIGLYQTSFQLHFEVTGSQSRKDIVFNKDFILKWEVK